MSDGSAGDTDYGRIGGSYARYRQPEPGIERLIAEALGESLSVVNVGAGAGSYEPRDRAVTAVEPSASMRAQRPAGLSQAVDAAAENLPFADNAFDAAMATFTIHQWGDLKAGLAEMRRVARGPVVILTCDPAEVEAFWLNDYAPAVLSTEARRYPSMAAIREGLGTEIETIPVAVPLDCRDGFNEAYYGRPEKLLDADARLACSAWSFVSPEVAAGYVEALSRDIESGAWDEKYGALRHEPHYRGSLYLVISRAKG